MPVWNLEQLCVIAAFDDLALVEHKDYVRIGNGRETVSYGDGGLALGLCCRVLLLSLHPNATSSHKILLTSFLS